jgi:hypothetical protein
MAIPEHLGRGFDPLSPALREQLPIGISPLAKHIYIKAQRTPGIRGQIPTTAVELYVDLSSPDLVESERSHWQSVLGCSEGLHIVANERRSQVGNLNAAIEQLEKVGVGA